MVLPWGKHSMNDVPLHISIGFVTFHSAESAKMALNASDEQLVLDGR